MAGRQPIVARRPSTATRVAPDLAPFAAASLLAALVALVGSPIDWPQYAAALGLMAFAGGVRMVAWRALPPGLTEAAPSFIFLVAVTLLRSAAGGANAGVSVVALLPVFWTALYGDRRQLFLVTLGVAAFFLAPLLLVGAPTYPHSQYRAAVLYLAVSAIIGFTTQRLVAQVRYQAGEAEQRGRMLAQIAKVMRGLPNSTRARVEACDAARSIGGADLAVLFEPVADGSSLRTTAISGHDVPQLETRLDEPSQLCEAFVSQRSRLVRAGDSRTPFGQLAWEAVGRPDTVLLEPVIRHKKTMGVLLVCWPQNVEEGDLRTTAVALLAHEIGAAIERADQITQLSDMASTDALTGLPNRRAWEASLTEALAGEEQLVVAMFDLDHFKEFNDTRGHPAGDRLLKEAAAVWRGELRTGDFLARVGGEEFALLLPKCSLEDALNVVERLRQSMPYDQTCSAGVAVRIPAESAENLMARADAALYSAKADGRDCVWLVP